MRKLKSMSGSQNESDEIVAILSKRPRNEYRTLVNQYGSDYADRWAAKQKAEKQALAEKEKFDISALEAKIKEEREHNDAFEAETKRQYEEQQSKNKFEREESGYQLA